VSADVLRIECENTVQLRDTAQERCVNARDEGIFTRNLKCSLYVS